MTNWLPQLSGGKDPLYIQLADCIESDIDNGVLESGTKLPPQRNLAFDMGVTVGTVGRAYSLLRERGLAIGEIGRGTFIRKRGTETPVPAGVLQPRSNIEGTRLFDPPTGKLRFDSTAACDIGQGSMLGRMMAGIAEDFPSEISTYTRRYYDHWFEAGSQWLSRGNFRPDPSCIVPTLGAHAAIMAVVSAVTSPGDHVVHEHLTYTQITRSTELIGRRTALVRSDDEGVIPEDFERLCARQHPRIAFFMPTAQNPTLTIIPRERRKQIAEIAHKYNVWIIEDDLYGSLTDDKTPFVAEFAPDRTFVVGGLSKSVAAGVRGGWVACPSQLVHRVRVAHKMITGGLPFVLAELCARLVISGEASRIRTQTIAETNRRLSMVSERLAGASYNSQPNLPFVWLALPDPWLSGTFKNAAFQEGVLIDDEDEFRAGRSEQVFHRVRIGISAEPDGKNVLSGLETIRRLLESGRSGYDSFG